MSLIELGVLFPKYLFKKYSEERIMIYYKDYTWRIYMTNINLECMQDIYNSIKHVEQFLILNDFVASQDNMFCNAKLDKRVYVKSSIYVLSTDGIYLVCYSDELLFKLKEILDVESRNKQVINE